MTTPSQWHGANVRRARAYVRINMLPNTCPHCHTTIAPNDDWVVGHIIPRWQREDLTLTPSNWRPEHRTCSDKTGPAEQQKIREAARLAAQHGLLDNPKTPVLSQSEDEDSRASARLSPQGTQPEPTGTSKQRAGAAEPPLSRPEDFAEVPWVSALLPVPENAAWPRHMSPPHPDAVGSYGEQLEEWVLTELGVTLRWWQRLAMRRQLEHDADGRLVWTTIAETGPRRIGKSVRLRVGALWRMVHGAALFGETQLVVHTGRDLAIVREIQRQAWPYALLKFWTVTKANGKEAIENDQGDRWLARAVGAVYGYDVTLGMIDESWDVAPEVFDEGLEPAAMERLSAQNVLTSTAHRRATVLMRRIITAALAGMGEDWDTLLLMWAADRKADPGDRGAWKAASPHWSPEREKLIASKYERAMRGEADPTAEDPDPIEGFRAQYLNVWPLDEGQRLPGELAVTGTEWTGLAVGEVAASALRIVGVESWFAQGASVAVADRDAAGRVSVEVRSFPSVDAAAAWVADLGQLEVLLVGKSLASDVRFAGCVPMAMTIREAAVELRRLVDDQSFTHTSDGELDRQIAALRTAKGPDGPRVVSRERGDAVKALVWTVTRACEGYVPFVIR